VGKARTGVQHLTPHLHPNLGEQPSLARQTRTAISGAVSEVGLEPILGVPGHFPGQSHLGG